MNVLVSAATEHSATREIAAAIARVLRNRGLEVALLAPEDVRSIGDYDAAVIGSAVYIGHWLKPALNLVERSADEFATRPVWLFSSGPIGDPSRALIQKMAVDPVDLPVLREITQAKEHRIFAGKLEKRNLTRPQRIALTLFRGLQGDFRDWSEIERWADGIADDLRSPRESAATAGIGVQAQ